MGQPRWFKVQAWFMVLVVTGVPYRSGLAGLGVGADAGEFETGGAGHVADAAGEAIEADGGDEGDAADDHGGSPGLRLGG